MAAAVRGELGLPVHRGLEPEARRAFHTCSSRHSQLLGNGTKARIVATLPRVTARQRKRRGLLCKVRAEQTRPSAVARDERRSQWLAPTQADERQPAPRAVRV